MAEESSPRVEEKPATHKRKLQLWLFISSGIVLGLLAILTGINIYTKMKGGSTPAPVEQMPAPPRQSPDRVDQMNQLMGNRRPSTRPVAEDADRAEPASLEQQFENIRDKMPGGGRGGNAQEDSDKSLSNEEKALRQWKAREALRALDGAKAQWGLSQANARRTPPPGSTTGGSTARVSQASNQPAPSGDVNAQIAQLNRPFNDNDSLEQRRAEVRLRIEEAQRLRATLAREGAAGMPQAAGRPVSPGTDAPETAAARQNLQQVSSSFSKPPPNVKGYTKDNKYNADVEGMIKIPPGTEVLTTLTKKAVSDYAGSSLKSIVNRDVYDISRRYVLIPKGTEINIGIARMRNVNEAISNRVGFLVKNGVLPNGDVLDFSKATTADREGVGAIQDQTDYHFWPQFFGVAAYALVSSNSSYAGTGQDEGSYAGDVGEGVRDQFSPLAQKYLNIVPTQTIRPGQSFQVIIEEEMYVEPWSDLYAKYVD